MYLLILFVQTLLLGVVSEESGNDDMWPKGHLQPLGSHRPPDAVEERDNFPSPEEFWENYVKISKPVVFRGGAVKSKAFELWTKEFLQKNYGNLEVRLEGKKEKQSDIPIGAKGVGRDTIDNFINNIHTANAYVVSELPIPMWDDVTVIPSLTCGTFANRLVEVDLWMSGGGTSSILHKDAFNAINCLLNGTKEWKLIEFKYQDKIYKVWEPDREIGGFSALNIEAVDLIKYPKVQEVPWAYTKLNAGDCLFLPKSMWHQVKSGGSLNAAVALLFSRFDEDEGEDMEFTGCDKELVHIPLSKFELDWQYPGYGEMTMGNSDLFSIRHMLKRYLEDGGVSILTLDELIKMFQEFYAEKDDEWVKEKAAKTLAAIELHMNGPLSLKDLDKCNKSCLRTLALAIEPTTTENTENFEYNYINPESLRSLIINMVTRDNQLERNKFIKNYQQFLHGTEKFAEMMYISLGGKDKTVLTTEEVREHIEEALQPYEESQTDQPEPPEDEENFPSPYEERSNHDNVIDPHFVKDEL